LTILVQDNGASIKLSDEQVLMINVQDVNDNLPEFNEQGRYQELIVSEGDEGSSGVFINKAFDRDSAELQSNYYYIVGGDGSSMFGIDKTTRELKRIQPVDRETNDKYSIVLKVTEDDSPPAESGLTCLDVETSNSLSCVNITVGDINDTPPKFDQQQFITDVALDVQPDEKNAISYVSATDQDLQENTKLSYSINTQETCCNTICEPLGNKFRIDENSGAVYLIDYVELKTGCSFKIGVHVNDGIESQSDDAVLTIGVIKDDQTVKLLSSIESDKFPKLEFEQDLGAILEATVIVDKILSKQTVTRANKAASEVTFHAKKDTVVVPVNEIQSVLDSNEVDVNVFLATYGIVGQTVTTVVEEDNTTQIIAIVIVAVLALLCVALLTAVICLKRKINHNKKIENAMMETREDNMRERTMRNGFPIHQGTVNTNQLFNLANEGIEETDLDNLYQSDVDVDIDDNSVDMAQQEEKSISRSNSEAEFKIDYTPTNETSNMHLAAALNSAVGDEDVNFDDTQF